MKALAHRLRGRRTSKRNPDEADEIERSFRREDGMGTDNRGRDDEATDNVNTNNQQQQQQLQRHNSKTKKKKTQEEDNWRKNRGLNSKTGSCNSLAALAASTSSASSSSVDVVPPSFINAAPVSLDSTYQQMTHGRTASLPTPMQHQRMLNRAPSNSRLHSGSVVASAAAATTAAAAVALRSHGPDNWTMSSSSSSGHSAGSNGSRRTRSRHGGSMSSNASSFISNYQKPEVAVDVGHQGYLVIKRGLLKTADKRYYFVTHRSPELYSCKDETSFSLWLASGHPLDPHDGDITTRSSGLSPVLVGIVLRADGSMDENNSGGSHPERMVSVMIGSASKCITLRLGAESAEKATQWVEALQEVQVTKKNNTQCPVKSADNRLLLPLNEHNALRVARADSTTTSECSAREHDDASRLRSAAGEGGGEEDVSNVVTRPASSSNAKMPRAYAAGRLQSKRRQVEEEEAAAVSTPTSHTESSPTSASGTSEHVEAPVTSAPIASPSSSSNTTTTGAYSLPHPRIRRMDSVASCSSTASGQSQGSTNGNVLLFVPVAGSSLTASASRMAKAQQELDALVAKGAKVPSRVMENPSEGKPVEWRYGAPEYVLTDLAYVKGRSREPDGTPLASYVEECCQTLIMEATHKVRYDQWHSVNLDTFYLQVNDGERVPGASILENDMLGLLYLGGIDISTVGEQTDSDESQDPRAELAEAFPDGFPMEVLEVFTQPPQCYFSWRHWGPFSGKYRGVKGDGSRVEVRGFGEMTVDASRIRSLRLFFKYQDLFAGLRRASDRVVRNRREAVSIAAPMSLNITPGRPLRTGSAAVAPVVRKESAPGARTNDIIEGLANFTLEAQEQQRKQTR